MTTQLDPQLAALSARLRREYVERPGLTLTLLQACRRWNVEETSFLLAVRPLLASGFLCFCGGRFVCADCGSRAA